MSQVRSSQKLTTGTTLRVGQVAEALEVSASTIRSWERRYQLAGERTSGGHRRYHPRDVEQLRALRDLVARGHGLGRDASALAAGDAELLLAATRSVLRAADVDEITATLTAFVRVLGGDVVGADRAGRTAIPFDLSFGEGDAVLPTAEKPSVARLRLEQSLPALVEDARHVIALLRASNAT